MEEKEINRHWKRIINTMTEGLMLVGKDGTILMVNDAFENLTGYSADDVIGRSCALLHCDACEAMRNTEKGGCWCTLFEENHRDMKRCRCGIIRSDT
jgi:two-component system, NtrC family, response regulator HydG